MSRALTAALAAVVALTLVGCDSGPEAPAANHPVLDAADKAIRTGRQAKQREVDDLAKRQLAFRKGWETTWAHAYVTTMQEARDEGPSRFRGDVLGEWFGLILLGLLLGILMRVLLSVRLPRLEEKKDPGLIRRGAAASLRGLRSLKKGLVIAAGPSADDADEWMLAVQTARDVERHLSVAARAALDLEREPAPEADAEDDPEGEHAEGESDPKAVAKADDDQPSHAQHLAKAIEAWRAEIAAVRRHLEDEGSGTSHRRAHAFFGKLDKARKEAQTLAVELTRAVAREETLSINDWTDWHAQVKARTAAPSLKKDEGKQVPGWIRTAGWAGAGGLVASVLLLAAWAAAGAMPFFLAFLVTSASLFLTVGARVALGSRSDHSLLPGLADRLIVRLAVFVGVVLFVALLSNMNSAQSGLDLGDPPLVDVPKSLDTVAVPAPPVSLMPQPRGR